MVANGAQKKLSDHRQPKAHYATPIKPEATPSARHPRWTQIGLNLNPDESEAEAELAIARALAKEVVGREHLMLGPDNSFGHETVPGGFSVLGFRV